MKTRKDYIKQARDYLRSIGWYNDNATGLEAKDQEARVEAKAFSFIRADIMS